MLDFNRASIEHFAVHYIGNKGNGEDVVFSKKEFVFKQDFVKDALLSFFLQPFKNDVYYQFSSPNEAQFKNVAACISEIFSDQTVFFNHSLQIAKHLFDQSNHPKIKGGEFYLAYFKDCKVDGELTDAIGIFKSETRETYIKIFQHIDGFEIETENGININKLDKGALIYNIGAESGYKISVVDNSHRIAEAALYWTEDFLNLQLRQDNFYFTQQMIATCKEFCEEVLTEENNVPKTDQLLMMNRSLNFFKENDKFKAKDFEEQVMSQPELIEAFREFSKDFNKDNKLHDIEDFEISDTAVRKNQKYMRSVLKLDKNFHVYVHGRHDYIQKGFDEDMGMKYYKLYFQNEE